MFVDPIEIGFLGGMCEVALFDLFGYIAIDQALKSNSLAHRQALVDSESETFGRPSGIRLGWIIFDRTQSY
jgi:hypothetical protein